MSLLEYLENCTSETFRLQRIRLLIDQNSEVNELDSNNENALHKITNFKYLSPNIVIDFIKLLSKNKININQQNLEGSTPLLNYIESGQIGNHDEGRYNIIKTFLDLGADPNIKNLEHFNTLTSIGIVFNPVLVKLVLKYGADPNSTYESGLTIIDRYLIVGRKYIIDEVRKTFQLLLAAGIRVNCSNLSKINKNINKSCVETILELSEERIRTLESRIIECKMIKEISDKRQGVDEFITHTITQFV